MAFDYSEIAAQTLELLAEFGEDITRRSYSIGKYSAATGANEIDFNDTARKGVLFSFGAGQTLANSSLIQVGDMRLLVDASGIIDPQDHFVIAGKEYVIISMDVVAPAGLAVLYDLHIRIG